MKGQSNMPLSGTGTCLGSHEFYGYSEGLRHLPLCFRHLVGLRRMKGTIVAMQSNLVVRHQSRHKLTRIRNAFNNATLQDVLRIVNVDLESYLEAPLGPP